MAKKNLEEIELNSENISEGQDIVKDDNLPEIVIDKEAENVNTHTVEKKVRIKLIKDLPRLFIINDFYSGLRGETLLVPESVAYILKGSDNTTDVFAV